MKTIKILNYLFVVALGFCACMYGIDRFGNDNAQLTGDTTLYTKEYCSDIIGFNGSIPLEISMKDGKIANIIILENDETPRFMQRVTDANLIEKFYGLTPKEAIELDIDAVSGATYSSTAIIKSVTETPYPSCGATCPVCSPWPLCSPRLPISRRRWEVRAC